LPAYLTTPAGTSGGAGGREHPALTSLDDTIQRHITRVLAATDGNKKRAAEILGVDRRTLYRMLERYATPPSEAPPEA
jgi:DNA-binding NtrC family response regulator